VLDETVGVQVRRFGGLGDFTTVSIRGNTPGRSASSSTASRSRARSETINLADLPLDQLGSVEIYRGVSPLALSSSALAGAINLVSRAPDDVPRFSLLAGGGSFGTRKVSAAGSAARGALAGLVSATYLGSDGDFEFEDDNGTLQNPDDDQRTKRKNKAFDVEAAALLRRKLGR
jgi:iron complex outermembrane receptor protein